MTFPRSSAELIKNTSTISPTTLPTVKDALDNLAGRTPTSLPVPINEGGTGQTTANAAFNALAPTTTRGDLIYRNATVNARLEIGSAGTVLQSNGTDPAWVTPPIPSGTSMLFFQAAAPTGWTKSTTHNDKAIRIVSGTGGGSGGSSPFSTVFAKTATNNHTLTSADTPLHNHTFQQAAFNPGFPAPISGIGAFFSVNYVNGTGNYGSSGAHSHAMDIRVQYVDAIICTKD